MTRAASVVVLLVPRPPRSMHLDRATTRFVCVAVLALVLPACALDAFQADDPMRAVREATIHPVVATMPASEETSIEAVAHYILARVPDRAERVKALHDWVADRIAYDVAALRIAIREEDVTAEAVFRRRRGVCSGYAALLEALGAASDTPIRAVHGDTSVGRHAWNTVSIDGIEYQLDATWDAGRILEDHFVKRYTTAYLLRRDLPKHGEYRRCGEGAIASVVVRGFTILIAQEAKRSADERWRTFREAADAERQARIDASDWKSIGL